jgi:chromosome partitioning protein
MNTVKKDIKVISVINMKGGVGKTTLTTNLTGTLAKYHGKKVLLVDNDPQFNATQSLVKSADYLAFINNSNKCTILDIYRDRPTSTPSITKGKVKVTVPKPSINNIIINVRTYSPGRLDILPSTLALMELDAPSLGTEQRLSIFIDQIKNEYDFIFIDCPPTMSLYTLSGFIASDAYLIPVKPDILSSIGFSLLERAISSYF